ncbi:LAMI_0F05688g1_1 [Lachancea mirantina]|uniref:LAMI_0F05688g1_1 n=1 Tax=Lachancea mirantina TaxID=1230905 RepID=A0A1G4JYE3_9SACH|nr:LAMI_0F05688g1_1 [Lachancea mirantina]
MLRLTLSKPRYAIQDLAARTLGGEKLMLKVNECFLEELRPNYYTLSDVWLSEAISPKSEGLGIARRSRLQQNPMNTKILLSVERIVKTLRRLRVMNDKTPFFALLNRLGSSDIEWDSPSYHFADSRTPLELYNEIAYMLHDVARQTSSVSDRMILSKFTLSQLDAYLQTTKSRELQPDRIFLKNCIDLIIQSGSHYYVRSALKLVSDEELENYGMLAFYLQTNQVFHLEAHLQRRIYSAKFIDPKIFSDLLYKCACEFIKYSAEEQACDVLQFGIDHQCGRVWRNLNRVRVMAKKYGMFKLTLVLNKARNSFTFPVSWKAFQEDLNLKDYISLLEKSHFDFYKNFYAFDFLLNKLSDRNMSVSEWRKYIDQTQPSDACRNSLKEFHLLLILNHVASSKGLGFLSLLLHSLMCRSGYANIFINTLKLNSGESRSGFRAILHCLSKSTSSTISGYESFRFFTETYPKLSKEKGLPLFDLNQKDYCLFMRTCLSGTNYRLFYFYFFHYLMKFQKDILKVDEVSKKWVWAFHPDLNGIIHERLAVDLKEPNIIPFSPRSWKI